MEFVQNFTPPDFQAKNFTLSISPNFKSLVRKNTKNGEIYTAGKNFTLPPELTAWTNSTSEIYLIIRALLVNLMKDPFNCLFTSQGTSSRPWTGPLAAIGTKWERRSRVIERSLPPTILSKSSAYMKHLSLALPFQ